MQIMTMTSWTDYKTMVAAKQLLIQYAEIDNFYDVYAPESDIFLWNIKIYKDGGASQIDFETNYKPFANKTQFAEGNYGFRLTYETTVSQTEIPIVLVKNPAASGKIIRLDEVLFACQSNTSGAITTRIYYDPTVTANGTVYTPIWGKCMTSPPTSAMNIFLNPTTSAFGTKTKTLHSMTGESLEYDFNDDPLIVDPNHAILFTLTCFGNSRPAGINLTWREV